MADEYFYMLNKNTWYKIFFDTEKTNKILGKVLKKNLLFIEKQLSMYQTFAYEDNLRISGLLNSIENPTITIKEKENFLLYTLNCGDNDIKLIALYHILNSLEKDKHLDTIKESLRFWEHDYKSEAQSIYNNYLTSTKTVV